MKELEHQTDRPEKKQFFFRGSNFLRLNFYKKFNFRLRRIYIMKKAIGCLSTVILAINSIYAADGENLLRNGDFSSGSNNWINASNIVEVNGNPALQITQNANVVKSRQKIAVDTAKTYKLSASVSADKVVADLLIGLENLDKSGFTIFSQNVVALPDTETTLVSTVNPGDKVIKVKDASKWGNGKNKFMVFYADKELKDLPNFSITPPIAQITRNGDIWEVELTSPYNVVVASGTPVRMHEAANTHPYCAANAVNFTGKKIFEGTIGGVTHEKNIDNKFRAGTTSVNVILIVIFDPKNPDAKVTVDDIIFTEVEGKK
jgi:hypothetical protein